MQRIRSSLDNRPYSTLITLSILIRIITLVYLYLAKFIIPTFDPQAQPFFPFHLRHYETFARWDTLHFIRIAKAGYTIDQELAFMPGLPFCMRILGKLIQAGRQRQGELLVTMEVLGGGIISAGIAGTLAILVLYKLTLTLTSSRTFAQTTALLFLIPPSPPTLNAVPYTEPFAALFTFLGMFFFLKRRWILASLAWAMGSALRAQGMILGVGFFGWEFILGGGRASKSWTGALKGMPTFLILSSVAAAPFFMFQAWAYRSFCTAEKTVDAIRPWCLQGLGLSYGWVQREYWNIGLFRYWTLLQTPNFALAAPVLLLSWFATYDYYSHNPRSILQSTFPFLPPTIINELTTNATKPPSSRLFLSPALLPFIHLHTALTLLLLLASHVQIILRVSVANPVIFWYVADLMTSTDNDAAGLKRKRWGERWIKYCCVWGSIAGLLWSGYYPPA